MAENFEGREHGFPLARFYGETHLRPQFRGCGARMEILCSSHPQLHSCQPEKCSWTYLWRAPDHIPSTQKMFIDLSGFRSSCLSLAANLKNVRRPIRADLSVTRVLSTRKMFLG